MGNAFSSLVHVTLQSFILAGALVETSHERYHAFLRDHLALNCLWRGSTHHLAPNEELQLYTECDINCAYLHDGPGFGWMWTIMDRLQIPTTRFFLHPLRYDKYVDPKIHWLMDSAILQEAEKEPLFDDAADATVNLINSP